ncbi:MAG: hypothetical protein HYZ53_08050 [Planctomycetes bacterium]|nr:hypothetical protein [Planctomycetota bacterium]
MGTCAGTFVALDFETANVYRNSACAVGMVRVERGRVRRRFYRLLRPPFRRFDFTYVHGIDWAKVEDQPTFLEAWPEMEAFLSGARFIAAHNAPFDRSVLLSSPRSGHGGVRLLLSLHPAAALDPQHESRVEPPSA